MQRYFVKIKENDTFILNDDDSFHVINVMRMNINDNIEIVYENNLYICNIINLEKPIKCKIIDKIENNKRTIPKVIIAQALVKEQKMDYILQKACELGVYEIIPINTERSIIRLNNDNKKIERWNKILKEASEQSKRVNIPKLDKILNLSDLISLDFKGKYICSLNNSRKSLKSILSKTDISDTIIFVIGPEGGFSKKEEDLLIDSGFVAVSLGNNVLRTETASAYILSSINYEFER